MITQARLKELMEYNPITGKFSRKVSRGGQKAGCEPGTINKDGYIHMMIDRHRYKAHRLAWLYVYGVFPENQIDHKDGKRAKNDIDNFRDVNNEGNSHNQHFPREKNISGFLVVSFRKRTGNYQARIRVKYQEISLGFYPTAELAHQAYLKAKRNMHPTSTL